VALAAVTQGAAVKTAISNSRTANTVGTPTTGGKKTATACREDNNKIDTINMRWQQQQWRSQQQSAGTPATAAETHNWEWQIFAILIS
jgi:hypothetical protein